MKEEKNKLNDLGQVALFGAIFLGALGLFGLGGLLKIKQQTGTLELSSNVIFCSILIIVALLFVPFLAVYAGRKIKSRNNEFQIEMANSMPKIDGLPETVTTIREARVRIKAVKAKERADRKLLEKNPIILNQKPKNDILYLIVTIVFFSFVCLFCTSVVFNFVKIGMGMLIVPIIELVAIILLFKNKYIVKKGNLEKFAKIIPIGEARVEEYKRRVRLGEIPDELGLVNDNEEWKESEKSSDKP